MTAPSLALAILQAIVIAQASPDVDDAAASSALRPAKSFHIRRWTMEDGLPQTTVTTIAQTADGYLWLGTFGGLVRFDGVHFRTYTMEDTPGLTSNRIVSLCNDRDGSLWIGTENGGLLRKVGNRFERVANPQETGIVWQIMQDGAGDLWIVADELFRIRDGHWKRIEPFGDAEGEHIITMHVDAKGRVWLGSKGFVLRGRDGAESFDVFPIDPLYGEFLKIVTTPQGRAWIIAANGIGNLDASGAVHVVESSGSTHPACGIIDAEGDLLFSHKNSDIGVLRDGKTLSRIQIESHPERIGRRIGIRDLVQNEDGILWAGTNIGLLRLSPEPFFRAGPGIGIDYGTRHIFTDGADGAYIEPESTRVALHWDGKRLHRIPIENDGRLAYWRAIGGSSRGAIVTTLTDTWRVSESGVERIDDVGVASGALEDSDGTLWFHCEDRLVWKKDDASGVIPIPWRRGANRLAALFCRTRDNAIWFAHGAELGRLGPERTPESLRFFGAEDGAPAGDVRGAVQDRSGAIWFSSYGAGLYRLRDGNFVRFGTTEGLPDTNLGGILEDGEERLWINSNRGIIVIPIASLNAVADASQAHLTCHVLSTGEVNGSTALRTPDGRMWFPTIDDLIITTPDTYHTNEIPPRVIIESVDVDGTPVEAAKGMEAIMSGANVQFAYTAFSYAHPMQLRFRYRLDDYDTQWHDVGNRRTAYYTRVPPGDYVFRVLAANEDGVWSETSATLPLRVKPQLHETTMFRLGVVLAVILLLVLAHRHRVSLHRRHAKALSAEIRQREKSEGERRRLEKLLRESTKLEAVGRLAGGVAHDFNNVLAAILGSTDTLQHELANKLDDETKVNWRDPIECISASGQRAARLTRQLLAYSRRLVLRPTTIDANDVILKLLPMLRQLLPDNIELTTNLTDDVASMRVDVTQLEQIVMNLVLNARDAIHDGGTIGVTTAVSSIDESHDHGAGLHRDTPYVMIAISDTGEGISDEALPRIFEPFFTTRFESGGAGLGLATVQGVVYQSGGHIFVDNKAERGTTFRIYLPLASTGAIATTDDDAAPVQGGSETILVCEDDEQVRRLACRALERAGYKVLEAGLPSQARLLFDANGQIDLLITDVVMPLEDGFSLASAFAESHPAARTLFISGYANVTFDMPEISHADRRFLGKPFLTATLLREVRRILDET
ncbi:MAG TPA: two-component regulator propeller domain-containing protein [Phycisphaerae bacterium]|nr:two-component regulator propeller domain-containing protein [Phycisphaerae bacterium]HRW54088.1 two-component regulator propeller domain-containing protein [Phycisphaerae bacterium]